MTKINYPRVMLVHVGRKYGLRWPPKLLPYGQVPEQEYEPALFFDEETFALVKDLRELAEGKKNKAKKSVLRKTDVLPQ